MTVAELIEVLKKLPSDTLILYKGEDDYSYQMTGYDTITVDKKTMEEVGHKNPNTTDALLIW